MSQSDILSLERTDSMKLQSTETPTSSKRKMKHPSTPKKKKSRRNIAEDPKTMFDDWFNQWREMNSNYTNVKISSHPSVIGKPNNFLMLSQRSIKAGAKRKSVLVHYKYIPHMIQEMQKLYTNLCRENGFKNPKGADKLIIDEWELDSSQSKLRKVLAELYAKTMVARFSDASRENCEGCACDAPSQRHHDCIMMSIQDRIDILFGVLIEKVNEDDINKMALDMMREEGNEIKGDSISKDILKKDEEWTERVNELMFKSLSY